MSKLVLFRTAKQRQGDRKRADKLRGKKNNRKKLIVGGVVGAGLILGGKVALKHHTNKKTINVTTGSPKLPKPPKPPKFFVITRPPKLLEPTKYPVVNLPKRK